MAFREVAVFEVREVLRLWLRGEGIRATQRLAGVDRKTVRRYLAAAGELGLDRDGGEGQLDDEFLGRVVEKVRPHRVDGHGAAWRSLEEHREQIRAWVEREELTTVKVGQLLARRGVVVPARTLDRFVTEVCGPRRGRAVAVRVVDGAPGRELQVDFGRMGLIGDPATGGLLAWSGGANPPTAILTGQACSAAPRCSSWRCSASWPATATNGYRARW